MNTDKRTLLLLSVFICVHLWLLSCLSSQPYLRLHAGDHLLQRQLSAVEDDGVLGGAHGGQVALRVAAVALGLVLAQRLQVHGLAPAGHLPRPPADALLGVGLEEELPARVGAHLRARAAALADHVAPLGDLTL